MVRAETLSMLQRALDHPVPASSDFDLNPDVVLPENRKLRPAAVLVAIAESENGPEVILTKRSSRLKHHPGQIAFPGGKQDPEDADVIATALREAQEETLQASARTMAAVIPVGFQTRLLFLRGGDVLL